MNKDKLPTGWLYIVHSDLKVAVTDIDYGKSGRVYAHVAFSSNGSLPANATLLELSNAQRRQEFGQATALITAHDPYDKAAGNPYIVALADVWDDVRNSEIDVVCLGGAAEPPPQSFHVDNLIPEGHTSALFADGGLGKSQLVLDMALATASGATWLGRKVRQGNVLFADWELDEETTLRRLYGLCRGRNLWGPPDEVFYASMDSPLYTCLDALRRIVREKEIKLLVIDSLGPASGGDPGDVEATIRVMNALRTVRTTKLIIDHQSKGSQESYTSKRQYGSVYKGNLARSTMQLELVKRLENDGGNACVLRHQKTNFMPMQEPIAFVMKWDRGTTSIELGDITSDDFDPEGKTVAWKEIFKAMTPGLEYTIDDLVAATGLKYKTIQSALNRDLLKRKKVIKGQSHGYVKPIE
jgi:hypothetical protein